MGIKRTIDPEKPQIKKAKSINKVKLVSYTLKATISTGEYENIQPEITVKAKDIEIAHKYAMDFINSIYNKLSKNAIKIANNDTTIIGTCSVMKCEVKTEEKPVETVSSDKDVETIIYDSPAYLKASQAVKSCVTSESLALVKEQIGKSVRLNQKEKDMLLSNIVTLKEKELNAGNQ